MGANPPTDWAIRQARQSLKQEAHMPIRMVDVQSLQALSRRLIRLLESKEYHDKKAAEAEAAAVQYRNTGGCPAHHPDADYRKPRPTECTCSGPIRPDDGPPF